VQASTWIQSNDVHLASTVAATALPDTSVPDATKTPRLPGWWLPVQFRPPRYPHSRGERLHRWAARGCCLPRAWAALLDHRDTYALLFCGVLLMPISTQMFTPLHCIYTETRPREWSIYLEADDSVECWTFTHFWWVFLSILAIGIIIPSTMLYAPLLVNRPSVRVGVESTVQYQASFTALRTMLRCVLPGTAVFFRGRTAPDGDFFQAVLVLCATVGMFVTVAVTQPSTVPTLNYLHLNLYAAAVWSASCTLIFNRETPLLVLLLGWASVGLPWLVPMECWNASRIWRRSLSGIFGGYSTARPLHAVCL
jgi:hypothetical protein